VHDSDSELHKTYTIPTVIMIRKFDSIPVSDAVVTMIVIAVCVAIILALSGIFTRGFTHSGTCYYIVLKNVTKIIIYLRCS